MRTVGFFVSCVVVASLGCGGASDEDKVATTSAPLRSPVTVTIQFDDGTAGQYAALTLMPTNMHATFYVNSGVIGDSAHMTWEQLKALSDAGHEIAGHTVDHTSLKKLSKSAARHEVCDDRNTLLAHNFAVTSFAYPFGSFDSGSKTVVEECGYNSGRGVSGVDERSVFAETIPPKDLYATRTPTNPKKSTKVSTLEAYVTAAEEHGGGWVQFVFHELCTTSCGAYSITQAHFSEFVNWLAQRAAGGTVVKTTSEVIGGSVHVPVDPDSLP